MGAPLTIAGLARRSGVAPATLRAWERRHGIVTPTRTPGGHRRYSLDDLARVVQVRDLVAGGMSLAAAAARVRRVALVGVGARPGPAPTGRPAAGSGRDRPATDVALGSADAELAALRAIVRATSPPEVAAALLGFVVAVGGAVVPPTEGDDHQLPLDLSLGTGPTLVAAAEPASVARLRLEEALPQLAEDARITAVRLRR
jgi:MerR family transcriptional regulator, light-induced transcriptional regulator